MVRQVSGADRSLRARLSAFGSRSARALLLFIACLGCGDTSGPRPFTVEPTLVMSAMAVHVRESDGWPEAVCLLHISALGRGTGGATWQGLTFRYFQGVDRSVLDHHEDAVAATVAAAFGHHASIAAGETLASTWAVLANFPFDVEVVLRYERVEGGRDSVTARSACGPRPPVSLPAAPALSNVSLTPTGAIAPGDEITIAFTVTGANLWATEVAGTGAFTRRVTEYTERFPEVSRQVVIEVPSNATTGDNFRAAIFAWDMFARFALRDVATGVVAPAAALREPRLSAPAMGLGYGLAAANNSSSGRAP